MNIILRLLRQADAILASFPQSLLSLIGRFAIAQVFWASGQTKVDASFHLRPEVIELFRTEYVLPLIPAEIAAPMAATAEHVFPILLVLGLGTRLAALGLLGMTAVIQLFVYPDAWTVHIVWAAILFGLIRHGGGAFALDVFRR